MIQADSACEICKTGSCDFLTRCGHIFHYECLSDWMCEESELKECYQCHMKISEDYHVEAVLSLFQGSTDQAAQASVQTFIKALDDVYCGGKKENSTENNEQIEEIAKKLVRETSGAALTEPLMIAVILRNLQAVDLLLKSGADVNAVAIFSNYTEFHSKFPFEYAIRSGFTEIVERLLVEPSLTFKSQFTPLTLSCFCGHVDIVKCLLANGSDINALDEIGWRPLTVACFNGHLDVLNLLAENGAELVIRNTSGGTLLHSAASKGNLTIAKRLIELGHPIDLVDNKGVTAIAYAIQKYNPDIAALLLDNGANMNGKMPYDNLTPFHFACQRGAAIKLIEKMIEMGVDVNSVVDNNNTALHLLAANNGNHKVFSVLLQAGANVNARNNKQRTPLHFACEMGNLELINLLIQHKADVNAQDDQRCTPLHLAVIYDRYEAAKLLLEYGANPNLPNNNNEHPINLVKSNPNNDKNMLDLLLKYNSKFPEKSCFFCS